MPDLNPDSLHAACQAMREAYRPDCILLRPDAMEAAITAYLAAEAELADQKKRSQDGHLLKALRRVRNSADWEDALKIAKNAIARHERATTGAPA